MAQIDYKMDLFKGALQANTDTTIGIKADTEALVSAFKGVNTKELVTAWQAVDGAGKLSSWAAMKVILFGGAAATLAGIAYAVYTFVKTGVWVKP